MRLAAIGTRDGQLRIFDEARLQAWVLKRPGQRFEVVVRDEAAVRSDRQNRFLHGPVLDEFARVWKEDGWRHSPAEGVVQELPRWVVRARFLSLFCPHEFVLDPEGHSRPVRRSTADLTVAEFRSMLDDAGEYLVHKDGTRGLLPSPDEWSE